MTTNLLICYPDKPFLATSIEGATAQPSSSFPLTNLINKTRAKYSELDTAISGVSYAHYTGTSSTLDHVALLRADLLQHSGVTDIVAREGAYSPNYPATITGLVLHLDAGRNVTFDSSNKVSAWGDISPSALTATQGTGANQPTYTRADGLENRLTYTSQFDNAAWTKTSSTITANATTNPVDGLTTADKLIEAAATADHYVRQSPALCTNGQTYYFSVFAKQAERTQIRLLAGGAAFTTAADAYFNLATGAVVSSTGGTTATITDAGSGWYLCTVSRAAAATGAAQLDCYLASSGASNYLGNGTSGVYIFGAQFRESGADSTYLDVTSLVDFEGTNGAPTVRFFPTDTLSLGTPTALKLTSAMTLFCVIDNRWPTNKGVGGEMFTNETLNASGYRFATDSTTTTFIFRTSRAGANSSLSAALTAGAVNVLAATLSAGTGTIYRDGSSVATGAVSAAVSATGTATVGFDDLSICELLIYNVALSGADITAINTYLKNKWKDTPATKIQQFDTKTLTGPASEDYISKFATTAGSTGVTVSFFSREASKRPLGKLYCGNTFDMGRDPEYGLAQKIGVNDRKDRRGRYEITLSWGGVTDAKRNDFISKIVRFKDINPVVLYDQNNYILNDFSTLHCELRDVEIEPQTTNTNRITATFEEVI